MILKSTLLKVSDNSKVKFVKCIKTYKNQTKVGSLIYASIQDIHMKTSKNKYEKKLIRGNLVRAVIIRNKKMLDRNTGNYVSFDYNEVVLLDEKGDLLGTRVFGPVPLELRKKGFLKLLSLASSFI